MASLERLLLGDSGLSGSWNTTPRRRSLDCSPEARVRGGVCLGVSAVSGTGRPPSPSPGVSGVTIRIVLFAFGCIACAGLLERSGLPAAASGGTPDPPSTVPSCTLARSCFLLATPRESVLLIGRVLFEQGLRYHAWVDSCVGRKNVDKSPGATLAPRSSSVGCEELSPSDM
jgi:hypothetical protein